MTIAWNPIPRATETSHQILGLAFALFLIIGIIILLLKIIQASRKK